MRPWLKLHRKIQQKPVWVMPPLYLKVWIWILTNVDEETGSIQTSLDRIAADVSWDERGGFKKPSRPTVNRVIQELEKVDSIRTEVVYRSFTRITVVNWHLYQDLDAPDVTDDLTEGDTELGHRESTLSSVSSSDSQVLGGTGGLDDVPPRKAILPNVADPETPVEHWLQVFRNARPSNGHPLQGLPPADIADVVQRVEDEIAERGGLESSLNLLAEVLNETPRPTSVKQAVYFCQRKAESRKSSGLVDREEAKRAAERFAQMRAEGKI